MKLIILVGNIGTGKTTYRDNNYSNGESIICPDEMTGNKEDIQGKMFKRIDESVEKKKNIVLDGNNITVRSRSLYIGMALKHGYYIQIVDFGCGNEETLDRRIISSKKYSPEFWKKIHLENLHKYEIPSLKEGCHSIIKITE